MLNGISRRSPRPAGRHRAAPRRRRLAVGAPGLALITIATLAALAGCSSGASSSAPSSAAAASRPRPPPPAAAAPAAGPASAAASSAGFAAASGTRLRTNRPAGPGHLRHPLHPRRPAAHLHRRAHRAGEERRRRAVDGDVDRDGGRRLRLGRERQRRRFRPARLEGDRERHAQDPGRRLPGHAGQADRRRARHPALPAAAGAGRDPAGRRRRQPGRLGPGGHHRAAGAAQATPEASAACSASRTRSTPRSPTWSRCWRSSRRSTTRPPTRP